MRSFLLTLLWLSSLGTTSALTQALPANPSVPTTKVLAIGRIVTAGTPADPAARRAIMPNEVKETANLYLEGKIDQWFVRQDGQGVVFLMNATSVADAKAMLAGLPLVRAGRMEFDLMPLGPLSPLRYLMGDAPGAASKP